MFITSSHVVKIMKLILLLTIVFAASSNVLANDDTIKMCIDMLAQKQSHVSADKKMTSKQIDTYCHCIIPKLEGIKAGTTPTNKELNVLYAECQKKAGVK